MPCTAPGKWPYKDVPRHESIARGSEPATATRGVPAIYMRASAYTSRIRSWTGEHFSIGENEFFR